MSSPWRTLVPFVIESLPQKLQDRKKVLAALIAITPRNTETRQHLRIMLSKLEEHEAAQLELPSIMDREQS